MRSFFASKIKPEVFLSKRCTTPGRSSPPTPSISGACASAAWTSVPEKCPARWVDYHPGWFVHNNQVLIFKNNIEWDRLGQKFAFLRQWDYDRNRRTGC